MRTNIDIDDELMEKAMQATGASTKKGAVEAALRQTIQLRNQAKIRELFGKVVWRGPEDDWSASDQEIRARRRQAEQAESAAIHGMQATKQPGIPGQENH